MSLFALGLFITAVLKFFQTIRLFGFFRFFPSIGSVSRAIYDSQPRQVRFGFDLVFPRIVPFSLSSHIHALLTLLMGLLCRQSRMGVIFVSVFFTCELSFWGFFYLLDVEIVHFFGVLFRSNGQGFPCRFSPPPACSP